MRDEAQHIQIYERMNLLETAELLDIWIKNDKTEWSELTSEIIKEILQERSVELPAQNDPVSVHQSRKKIPGKVRVVFLAAVFAPILAFIVMAVGLPMIVYLTTAPTSVLIVFLFKGDKDIFLTIPAAGVLYAVYVAVFLFSKGCARKYFLTSLVLLHVICIVWLVQYLGAALFRS
jgi:hypothetical protein